MSGRSVLRALLPGRAEEGGGPDFKRRAVSGALWTLVGYGTQQVLRLGSNIVNTRLLAPDAFGLMSLVFIFITGLELLSDVGVGPAIIQSKRGDDPRLLDTAFTVQVVRGFALFLLSVLVAWPASRFYDEPRLTALVIAAGLGIAIRGFTPTRVHALNRKVMLGRLTTMELLCQIVSIAATIAAAWALRSAWALLIGALLGDVARVALSYAMLPGERHRFVLDREAVREIVHVGRWVFVSTAVTFAVGNLDRLTMGRLLSVRELGVYTLAYQLCNAVLTLGRTVGSRVLFPVLAETVRTSPELLEPRLRKARALWVFPTVAALAILGLAGDWVVRLLYPAAFHDAGWMLRVLAVGSFAAVLNQATGVLWPALGEFRMITLLMVLQIACMFAGMFVGHAVAGAVGVVVGIAAAELLVYPVQAALVARRKLWQPGIDLPVLGAGVAVAALALLLHAVL